jgi:hypothetical protein
MVQFIIAKDVVVQMASTCAIREAELTPLSATIGTFLRRLK